jgi:hypothetical protein
MQYLFENVWMDYAYIDGGFVDWQEDGLRVHMDTSQGISYILL